MLSWLKKLTTTEAQKREDRSKAFSGYGLLTIASTQCIGPDRLPIRFVRRNAPSHDHDSGWRFYSGNESDEFSNNPHNFKPVQLARCIEIDESLKLIVESPTGSEWTRKPPEDIWRRIVDGKVVDDSGQIIGQTR